MVWFRYLSSSCILTYSPSINLGDCGIPAYEAETGSVLLVLSRRKCPFLFARRIAGECFRSSRLLEPIVPAFTPGDDVGVSLEPRQTTRLGFYLDNDSCPEPPISTG